MRPQIDTARVPWAANFFRRLVEPKSLDFIWGNMGDAFKSSDVHTIFARFRKAQLVRVIGRHLHEMYAQLVKERLPPKLLELLHRLEGSGK